MENSPELSLTAMELSLSQEQIKLYMYCYQHKYTLEGDESFAAWKALKDQVISSQLCTDTAITVSNIDVPETGLAEEIPCRPIDDDNQDNTENIDPTSSCEYGSVSRSDSFEMFEKVIFEDPLTGDTVTTELQDNDPNTLSLASVPQIDNDPSEPVANDIGVPLECYISPRP